MSYTTNPYDINKFNMYILTKPNKLSSFSDLMFHNVIIINCK